jgi:general L-amino acid transport system permease protein
MTSSPVHSLQDRPPVPGVGPLGWLRANLFNGWGNALLTLAILWGLVSVVPPLLRWGVFDSVVTGDAAACRAGDGACWAFIHEKLLFILFGTYPHDQLWRPGLVVLLFIGLFTASCDRRLWRRWLAPLWLAVIVAMGVLMWGGVFGLSAVEDGLWGGLPLTLGLATVGLVVAFPLSILLALGRRSTLPLVRGLSVAWIELIRGVPLISLLFMASVMLPLFLPAGVTVDKLLRAQVAFILFASAYLAEVVRGGLQAIAKGQEEAADALGLGYWQKMGRIILPQALALVIPPLVNTFIGFFKDTSLVLVIGLFDLLRTAKTSLSDPLWHGFYREAYLFIALIYFAFCFFFSRYSRWLEADLNRSRNH